MRHSNVMMMTAQIIQQGQTHQSKSRRHTREKTSVYSYTKIVHIRILCKVQSCVCMKKRRNLKLKRKNVQSCPEVHLDMYMYIDGCTCKPVTKS